jgi:hypothetical protein
MFQSDNMLQEKVKMLKNKKLNNYYCISEFVEVKDSYVRTTTTFSSIAESPMFRNPPTAIVFLTTGRSCWPWSPSSSQGGGSMDSWDRYNDEIHHKEL